MSYFIIPNSREKILNREIISLNGSIFLPENSDGILLNPHTGSWAVISRKTYNFLQKIEGQRFEDVLKKLALDQEKIERLILSLYNLGLCSLDGKWVVTPEYWERYCDLLPRLLILKTTNSCNLACKYCYAKTNKQTKSSLSLDIKLAEKVIIELSEIHKNEKLPIHVNFHGGEPLLFKHKIREIVNGIRSRGLSHKAVEFSIQTNGTLLDEQTVEFCKKNNMPISISLDGGPSENDLLRVFPDGRGTFKKVAKAIELCKNLEFDKFSVLTTITKVNVHQLPSITKLFDEMGIPLVKFSLFSYWGLGKSKRELAPSADDVVSAYTKILTLIEKGTLKNIFVQSLAHYIYNLVYFDRLYMCMRSPCGAGSSVITLDVDGSIYACDCGIGDQEFLLGNAKDASILDILKSQVNMKFRKRLVHNIIPCKDCPWRGLCMGTCTHRAYVANGTIYSADPVECKINQQMFKILIWKLYKNPKLLDYFLGEGLP